MHTSSSANILDRSVMYVKSVGPKRAESFSKTGIETIRQLLYFLPSRYLDRTNILTALKAYGHLMNGYEGEVTIIGKVESKEVLRYGKKELLKVYMRDPSGFFECVWFQGVKYMQQQFEPGEYYAVSSHPTATKFGGIQFVHPDYDKLSEDESAKFLNTGKIIPFYRMSKELRSTNIGDMSLRRIISSAVEKYALHLEETLTPGIIERYQLTSLTEAIRNVHFPENYDLLKSALRRIKFDELFYIELLVALRKHNIHAARGNTMTVKTDMVSSFLKSLPFELTHSQLSVLKQIRQDMAASKPMNRLLQGDVGSGKTIVALISMLIARDNGFQSVLMAPTEILADQHYKTITKLLEGFDVKVELLLGGQSKSKKKKKLEEIESHSDIIIGTHALLESNVAFSNLGLVIIDEQHRFGVVQRARIITKGATPDVIVMTATPIPRTLSMTVYGDLDISTITEMPANRKPVKTYLRGESTLPMVYQYIIDKHREGYQSFIVYPLVEESEKLELKAATTHYEELQNTYLKDLRLGLIHGQMNWQEKEDVMLRFKNKEYDVLVATTVIEVGIDIPDANIIVINDAHRFGLSQLHQLRGRVGRSQMQAYCIMITKDEMIQRAGLHRQSPDYLSESQLERNRAISRLQAMVQYTSGFDISEIDMKLRGPGDIFGTKQSGFPELKYADIIKDTDILIEAKVAAFEIIEKDPHFSSSENRLIKENLIKNYSQNFSYAKIA